MALIKCRECGKEVSSNADVCPHCGVKKPKKSSNVLTLLVITVVVGLIASTFGDKSHAPTKQEEPQKTKELTELEKKQNELADQRYKAYSDGYILLKKKMKDPSSFDVESACVMPNMTVCYKYRAKNGYGALDIGLAYVTSTSYATSDHNGFEMLFKKECDMSKCAKIK